MSVNPVISSGLPSNLAAIIAEELAALASDAQMLQGRLTTGDVVQAVVLPSNGLTDLLAIGGLRVAAELPPTLIPGETITVEVSGFSGDRINLHILPTAGPEPAADGSSSPRAALPSSPAAVVVSAAVGPAALSPAQAAAADEAVVPAAAPAPAPTAGAVAASAMPAPTAWPGRVVRPVAELPRSTIEARIATSRATVPPPSAPSLGARGSGAARLTPSVVIRSFIAQRPPASGAPAAAPADDAGAPRSPATYTVPAALLRALALPVTPSNVAAAQLALESPEKLPQILATLERALPAGGDPHVATLRTLVAFVSHIEPDSPVLATQVAAFVDQLIIGREGKLAALFAAAAHGDDEPSAANASDAPSEAQSGPVPGPLPSPGASELAAERVAFRTAALDYDLKTNLLAVAGGAADPERAGTPKPAALTAALNGALTALTALQVNAAVTLAAHPEGFAFALPIALPHGFAQAHVRIARDAPGAPNVALDGDNFHIGFVLETQHVGTVAVDLMTVGRSVTVGVRTEASLAQGLFARSLHALTERLESLRYRVVKAEATVAPRGSVMLAPDEPAAPAAAERSGLVDLDA